MKWTDVKHCESVWHSERNIPGTPFASRAVTVRDAYGKDYSFRDASLKLRARHGPGSDTQELELPRVLLLREVKIGETHDVPPEKCGAVFYIPDDQVAQWLQALAHQQNLPEKPGSEANFVKVSLVYVLIFCAVLLVIVGAIKIAAPRGVWFATILTGAIAVTCVIGILILFHIGRLPVAEFVKLLTGLYRQLPMSPLRSKAGRKK